MLLSQTEFEALINDESKSIVTDLVWTEDEDHSPAVEFKAEIESGAGYPIFIRGSYNGAAKTCSFSIIHKGAGRIYALDVGKDHRNPSDGRLVGEKHKHRWTEQAKDKEAYVPPDITAGIPDVRGLWQQFCQEGKIQHNGQMHDPPPVQEDLFS